MAKTVLVVDDSLSIRLVLKSTLEHHGYSVADAADAPTALLKIAGLEGLDLLVTDLNMPEMNGVELINVIRTKSPFPGVPILVVSTEKHTHLAEEALLKGANEILSKPFTPEAFLSRVVRLLEGGDRATSR